MNLGQYSPISPPGIQDRRIIKEIYHINDLKENIYLFNQYILYHRKSFKLWNNFFATEQARLSTKSKIKDQN